MPGLSNAQAQAMSKAGAPRYSVLIHIGTATPVRLWTGVGPYQTGGDDDLDPTAIYVGAGILTSLDPLRQLIGGTAERLALRFSGTDLLPQSWVDNDESDVLGAPIDLGLVFFGPDWQAVAPTCWTWPGRVDVATSLYAAGVESVELSCGSEFTDRSRASLRYWTDASHKSRHSGDNFCSRVGGYTVSRNLKWPG